MQIFIIDVHMKPYYVLQKELLFYDGVIFQKQILVIPTACVTPFLD